MTKESVITVFRKNITSKGKKESTRSFNNTFKKLSVVSTQAELLGFFIFTLKDQEGCNVFSSL